MPTNTPRYETAKLGRVKSLEPTQGSNASAPTIYVAGALRALLDMACGVVQNGRSMKSVLGLVGLGALLVACSSSGDGDALFTDVGGQNAGGARAGCGGS